MDVPLITEQLKLDELVIEAEDAVSLSEGRHEGTITDVKIREYESDKGDKFKYVDFYIKTQDADFNIKWGAPFKLSPKSKLGKFLGVFMDWKPGDKINLADLKDTKTSFLVGKKGDFAEIVDGTFEKVK